MRKTNYLVFSNPVEGCEDAFNAWYDKHVADISRVPGFASAQRFALEEDRSQTPGGVWRYLALYEIDGDIGQALVALRAAAESGSVERPDPDCVAGDIFSQVFHPVGDRFVAGAAVES
ncbi:MAG: hypothetical protein AB7Q27_20885 [Acidimicrobiia bacterium]